MIYHERPWPPPDTYHTFYEEELTGAFDLASLYFTPGVFLFSINYFITISNWCNNYYCLIHLSEQVHFAEHF